MLRSGVIRKQGAGLSGWKSEDSGGKPLRHGNRPPVLLPRQPGRRLPGRGLNVAAGDARGRGKKAASATKVEEAERSS